MTLKQFENVNTATRTRYTVFDKNGEYVDDFVNYILDEDGKCLPYDKETQLSFKKRMAYRKAKVTHVSFSKVFNALTVGLESEVLAN